MGFNSVFKGLIYKLHLHGSGHHRAADCCGCGLTVRTV